MLTKLTVLLFMGSSVFAVAQTAIPIEVPNGSFETGTMPLNVGFGPYSNILAGSTVPGGGSLPSWEAVANTSKAAAGAAAPASGVLWREGKNIGYVYVFGPGQASISTILATTWQPDTNYVLTAMIGMVPKFLFNYALQIWAGENMLRSSSDLLTRYGFVNGVDSVKVTTGRNAPKGPIRIVLVCYGNSTPGAGNTGVLIDSVTLTSWKNGPQ